MNASYGARWRARRDHSPRATPRQLLRSFSIAERAARARALGCHCSCFSLSLCVSVSRRFSSLPAITSRLCRRSALTVLVSVEAQPRLCLCSALVSAVDSASVSALLPSHLASATHLARRLAFYKRN